MATAQSGELQLYIDGELVDAASKDTFENLNPTTEEVLGVTADGGHDDADRAIAAARRAFDRTTWSTDPSLRRRCIEQLQVGLDKRRDLLREIVVNEGGSPVQLTYGTQVDYPIDALEHWAELTDSYEYETQLPEVESWGQMNRQFLRHEPLGVVGAITPWNFPLYENLNKIGPALAAGNTVVLKPAPDTPWSATILGRIIAEETDFPAGVVNIVASSDHLVGEVITSDPRVDMVTFTGSTLTGRRIMAKASETVKKLCLELGGKSPHIVLPEADMATVIPAAAAFVCLHAGQGCTMYTRLLVPRSRQDDAVDLAKTAMEAVNYGDPWDPEVVQGPQISKRQQERVLSYVARGATEGATRVTGGQAPSSLPKGFFVEPTLFANVEPSHTIAQEEIFGPVLSIIPYDSDDDAVEIANGTIYGLSGAVTGDEEHAMAIARRLRSGTVAVNGGQWLHATVPFGGVRQSGVGRQNGVEGFEEFLESKVVGLPAVTPGEGTRE